MLTAIFRSALALASFGGSLTLVHADVLVLRSGGQVHGRWVNRDQRPLVSYVMETESGGRLTIPAELVQSAVVETAIQKAYAALAAGAADTVEGQWAVAEWCRQPGLRAERERHLRRILELAPDHAGARHALGYSQLRGRWVTREEANRARGRVLHEGQWRLPQEIALISATEEVRRQETDWRMRLRQWRALIGTDKAAQACQDIVAIRDPQAVGPLAEMLQADRLRAMKMVYISALAEIATPAAIQALFSATLTDPDEEVFHACLDQLVKRKPPNLAAQYVKFLKDANNVRLNRAAYALGRLDDKSVLSPLIEALVTTHYVVLPSKKRSDSYTMTVARTADGSPPPGLAPPGTGFEAGSQPPQQIPVTVTNQEVLDALTRLSGGANFGFDQRAWDVWLAAENRRNLPEVRARRDTP